ncbi:MAG: LamG domain-containing protein [Patescibacteria group bacterium]
MKRVLFTVPFLLIILAAGLFLRSRFANAMVVNQSVNNSNLTFGLVGWWTMDGADTNATQALDKSGNGNTGARNGGTKLVSGKIGQAMKFDGSSGNIATTPGVTALTSTSTFTMSVWVYWNDTTANAPATECPFYNGGSYGFCINTGGNKMGIYYNNINATVIVASVLPKKTWRHYVMTRANGVSSLYENGVFKDSQNTDVPQDVNTFYATHVGELWAGPTFPFNGSVDDARIYSRALSATEVQQLYKLGGGKINQTPTINLSNGLVGWWTMDGADTNATQALDKSGYNNTGTRTTVTPVVGEIGQAMSFNGTSGYVNVPVSQGSVLDIATSTYSVWIYPTVSGVGAQSGLRGIITRDSGSMPMAWRYANDNIIFSFNDTIIITVAGPALNKWTLATVTYDGTNVRMYYNGVLVAGPTASSPPAVSSDPLKIGLDYTGQYSRYFSGKMDDVRIYSRALSVAEVKALYQMSLPAKSNSSNAGKGGSLTDSSLVGWWTFDGAYTNTTQALDKSRNSNTGTRTGGTKLVSGKLGQAMKFDGSSAYVGMAASAGNNSSAIGHTYAVWVYRTKDYSSGLGWVIENGGTWGEAGGSNLTISGNRICYYYNNANVSVLSNSTVSANAWHHIVVSYNANTNKATFYLDGRADGTSAALGSWDASTNLVRIGNWISGGGGHNEYYFEGSIDDARIYSRALSAAEVMQLYKMGK